ncbi:MAG: ribose-phosphate diphosphokinase [Spirochaetales bacterium]|nr:ribose-phosphate diphosphokinase [Spirochaetales bacterium]
MANTNLYDIGIIACPGGIQFATEIINHLKSISTIKSEKRLKRLGSKYNLSRSEIIKKINFNNDLFSLHPQTNNNRDKITIPEFNVPVHFTYFANGEFKTELRASVRDKDIYIVQDVANHYPLKFPDLKEKSTLSINDHILCLYVTIDAALQAGAKRVTVVLPTYPYSRQHKKKGREGLTAARFGQILEYMGVDRIITLDIHSREIENCFNHLRVENLHASYQIIKALTSIINVKDDKLVIVSPDTGAIDRNKFYAASFEKKLALLYKERDYSKLTQDALDNNIADMNLLGNVDDKIVFMSDDILGTGGTLLKALNVLRGMGAEKIICAVSLPFFTGHAVKHFEEAYFKKSFYRIIGTNAVYHDTSLLEREWYICANVSRLFAKTIYRLHYDLSLSPLLDNRKIISRLLSENNA